MRCLLILLLSLFIHTCPLHAAQPASSSRIAAVVNKSVITKADLTNRLRFAAISSSLEPTSENLERMQDQMLRVMIDEALQLELGKMYGLEIKKEHIDATIKDIEQSNGMPEGGIAKILNDNSIPLKTFEDQIKAQLVWMVYIQEKYPLKSLEDQVGRKQTAEGLPSLQVADWEIDQELKLLQEKEGKTQYHLAEIVLPCDTAAQEQNAKETLNNLVKELQKGANFAALAQQFSQSPTSSQGGDMGWLTEDQLEPEVREALSTITPGQLSDPLRISQGYALVAYIERKLPNKEGELLLTIDQVLLPFPQNVTEERAYEIMQVAEGISRSAKNCHALDKLTKQKFPTAAIRLIRGEPMNSFPEELQKVVTPLEINQPSPPLLPQDGALLLMVCERKTHKAMEFTREDARANLVARKHNLLARRELRDLKRHAFIEIRM